MTGPLDDDQLDAMGHRAAAQLRAEARSIADSPAALRQLLADAGATARAAAHIEPATVVPLRAPDIGARRRHLAVAAVIAVFVAGIGYALVNGVGGSIDIVAPTGTGNGPGLGGTTPATSTPGSTTPGSTTPGSTTVGSTTVGSTTVGSTTVGSTTQPGDGPGVLVLPTLAPIGPETARPLLPEPEPPSERTYRLLEMVGSSQASISQTWIRTDADGRVTGIVGVVGGSGPHPLPLVGEPVELTGWDTAVSIPSAFVEVRAQAGDLYVSVTVEGLPDDDALAIVRSLRTVDQASFTASLGNDWIEVQSQLRGGTARRILTTLNADGDVDTVLEVHSGTPILDLLPLIADTDVRLVTMDDGTPALLSRGGVSSLVFTTDSGNTVRLGSRDPEADLVTVAGSLRVVDEATWESAAQRWPADADGCVSLFC